MFTYSDDVPSYIIPCNLSTVKFIGKDNITVKNGGLYAEDLFPIDSG